MSALTVSADTAVLDGIARRARSEIVTAIAHAKGGHLGGPLSATDILVALYFRVMDIRPDEPGWPDRDRFILSKGHSCIAQYAVMALRGYFPVAELATFDAIDSRLQGHPDMRSLPGLDMSSGSLGLGLSAGVGCALGAQLTGREFTTFVMVGDGECNEGIVWESAHIAERYQLDNLVVVVDQNRLQQTGWRAGSGKRRPPYEGTQLRDQWEAFGWDVREVDGHDMAAIVPALEAAKTARGEQPVAIIAHTVKGKGVSFMENDYRWHSRIPTDDELAAALAELAGGSAVLAESAGTQGGAS